jgi:GTP-binding protein
MKPIVAIVGRPNVGKSRLFNRLIGYRKALVHDTPGVTRDRHYAAADWCGRNYIVIDTGGIDLDPRADIEHKITQQSLAAISEADVVICLFDGQVDPTPHDRDVAEKLRTIGKPVLFAVNKVDEPGHESAAVNYYRLGIEPVFMISAEHGRNVDDLLDKLLSHFPPPGEEEKKSEVPRITVVGRPNVGKSTLINRLAGSERVIVHEMPGTTRDAIDVEVEFEGRRYIFVDTAGIRKTFRIEENIEKFSAVKSLRAVDRSDIVCLLVDAAEGVTHQDLNLAGFVFGEGKGLIMLVNKWDLAEIKWGDYEGRIRDHLKELHDVPLLGISAKTGHNCLKVFERIDRLYGALSTKIATSKLNRILKEALQGHHMPVHRGREVNINYVTQTGTRPPTFTLFANMPAAVPYAYRRYLMRCFEEALGIKGIPIRLVFRKK